MVIITYLNFVVAKVRNLILHYEMFLLLSFFSTSYLLVLFNTLTPNTVLVE